MLKERIFKFTLHVTILMLLLSVVTGCTNERVEDEAKPSTTSNNETLSQTEAVKESETLTSQEPAYVEEYENSLAENQRYIWLYSQIEDTSKQSQTEEMAASSGSGPVKLKSLAELEERLKLANLDFYLPEYIPSGFKVENIGIYYYMCYDTFDILKPPVRDEIVEQGVNFKVYELNDNYKNYVQGLYIDYTNETGNSICYRYGLSTIGTESANDAGNQISKEGFLAYNDSNFSNYNNEINFRINQTIAPKEVFTGVPSKAYYDSPDYYYSMEMDIRGEDIEKDELVKIIQSIYKTN